MELEMYESDQIYKELQDIEEKRRRNKQQAITIIDDEQRRGLHKASQQSQSKAKDHKGSRRSGHRNFHQTIKHIEQEHRGEIGRSLAWKRKGQDRRLDRSRENQKKKTTRNYVM
eukprot:6091310-Heterocapsa_arctica.AAC.1